jgi:CRISPR/Cas system-associated exonuclease Cas4 (RecB family)
LWMADLIVKHDRRDVRTWYGFKRVYRYKVRLKTAYQDSVSFRGKPVVELVVEGTPLGVVLVKAECSCGRDCHHVDVALREVLKLFGRGGGWSQTHVLA